MSLTLKHMLITVSLMLWLTVARTQGMRAPTIYSKTRSANPGEPYTLVCTWSDTDYPEQPDQMQVNWTRGGNNTVYTFNLETCHLETSKNGSFYDFEAESGFLFQSLTFPNITESDIAVEWSCSFQMSNVNNSVMITRDMRQEKEVRLSSQSDVVYTGDNITMTCTFQGHTLSSATWYVDKIFYILDQNCSIRLLDDTKDDIHDILTRSQSNCSQTSSYLLTLTNVSAIDNNVTWVCIVGSNISNAVGVIVLDPPDLPNTVSISGGPGTNGGFYSLTCSSTCERKFEFTWVHDLDGSVSSSDYDSCKHVCSQTLTIPVKYSDNGTQINCTVTNPRTMMLSTAVYRIFITSGDTTTVTNDDDVNNSDGNNINPVIIVTPLVIFLILVIVITVVVYFKVIRPQKREPSASGGIADTRNEHNAEVDIKRDSIQQEGDHQMYAHYDDADIDDRRDSHPQTDDPQVSRDTRNTYIDLALYENPDNKHEYGKLHLYGNTSGAGASVQASNYQDLRVYGNQGDNHDYGKLRSSQ